MSSLDSLRPHLWPGYTVRWTENQWQLLEALAQGDNPGGHAERAVTQMLCAVDGPLGRSLAALFLDLCGLPVNDYAEMIDPADCASQSRSRAPDAAVRDAVTGKLLLVIEGKRDAWINFTSSCPHRIEDCNQVICYPSGCWAPPGALEEAGFLWVHPQDTDPWATAWHEGYLGNQRYEESEGPDRLRRLVGAHQDASALWRTVAWEDLVMRVRQLQDPADVIAMIISTWMGR